MQAMAGGGDLFGSLRELRRSFHGVSFDVGQGWRPGIPNTSGPFQLHSEFDFTKKAFAHEISTFVLGGLPQRTKTLTKDGATLFLNRDTKTYQPGRFNYLRFPELVLQTALARIDSLTLTGPQIVNGEPAIGVSFTDPVLGLRLGLLFGETIGDYATQTFYRTQSVEYYYRDYGKTNG